MTAVAAPRHTADSAIIAKGYAHPEVLVTTEWLAANLGDPTLRIIESNEDPLLFDTGHIPGAQQIDWVHDLNDPLRRDYIGREAFEALLRSRGIDERTPVILYGDRNNWWASYTFWVFRLFGFTNVRLLDGGRAKWAAEGRELTTEKKKATPSTFVARERNDTPIRAYLSGVLSHVRVHRPLIDVRSPDEFTGKKQHLPEYPQEGALRTGHVPGAKNIPWARAANADGSFKTADELRAIYEGEAGLAATDDVIVYCRIGERSAHTWFVLTHLLGYENVRNYDGSWTEYGNSVAVPIER
jgi:thiosulfate/3-mercaptopyruvate sulfurtransferase